jgi:phospholipid/cholesterol/gamma-HCH transport system ATP-binding protein
VLTLLYAEGEHTRDIPAMREKIKIVNLKKSFGERVVFSGVELSVYSGEILCIIGKSGSGKSVLLKNLIGLLEPDEGDIFVDGVNFTISDRETRRGIQSKYGILFQGAALFDSMNIYDNVAFGLRRKGISEREIEYIVPEMLEHVGLRDIEKKRPSELSGGMQKRVGLARSIAIKPEIMLYDEPTTGVDPITAGAVNELILKMRDAFRITSVVVTHDINSAYRLADRISMLFEGEIIFTGTSGEIRENENPFIRQFIEGRAHGPIRIS